MLSTQDGDLQSGRKAIVIRRSEQYIELETEKAPRHLLSLAAAFSCWLQSVLREKQRERCKKAGNRASRTGSEVKELCTELPKHFLQFLGHTDHTRLCKDEVRPQLKSHFVN